jgi:hypothetical protein
MRPVDIFFRSLRESFRPANDALALTFGVIALCVLLGVGLVWWGRHRRRRDRRRAFARLLVAKHLSPASVALVDRLARRARVDPMLVATHVDVFERSTADELARHVPSANNGDEGVFAQVRQLRHALEFHELAEHFPLLTTRELRIAMRVEVGGISGKVAAVNEACFVVEVPLLAAPPREKLGARVPLTLAHGHEARYAASCALLAREAAPEARMLSLGHDERPARIQLRAAVRIAMSGVVELRYPAPPSLPGGPTEMRATGTLQDVSVGGIALDTRDKIGVGSEVRASFDIDGTPCRDFAAWVLQCEPRSRGAFHLRLQFRDLSPSDENAVAAAVARHTAKPFFGA